MHRVIGGMVPKEQCDSLVLQTLKASMQIEPSEALRPAEQQFVPQDCVTVSDSKKSAMDLNSGYWEAWLDMQKSSNCSPSMHIRY